MFSPTTAYYLSCFLAFVGGHTVNYTIILFSQDVLGSDLLSGIGLGLCWGPPIVLGWFAGAYCDRYSPSKILVYSQLLFILVGLILLPAVRYVQIRDYQIALVVIAAFLSGCGWSFIAPARFAAVAQIAGPEKLHGATVILNTISMVGFGIAPLLIGFILSKFSWSIVVITFMSGFLLATLLLVFSPTKKSGKNPKKVTKEIKEGMDAVASNPVLFQLLITGIVFFTVVGPMQVLLPRIATTQLMLNDVDRGLFLGILALALIIGGALCMALRNKFHDGRTVLGGSIVAALGVVIISQISSVIPSAITLLIVGILSGTAASLIVAGINEVASDEVRGRIMSMYTITSQFIPAASGLFAGVLSQFLGAKIALLICGCIILLATTTNLIKLKNLRNFNRVD